MLAAMHAIDVFGTSSAGLLVAGVIIGGGVGAVIGSFKNRILLGFVLGFFLGCLGWIIIAVIPKKSRF
jgi:hypothetical protein